MKTYKYIIPCLCAAMAISCAEEPTPDQIVEESVEVTLSASSGESSTKTVLGELNTVRWADNDRISLLEGENNYEFTLSEGAGDTFGKFKGKVPSNIVFYPAGCLAVYPYSEQNATKSDYYQLDWSNGLTQTAVKDSYDPSAALMMGVVDDDSHIEFKHVMSYIKFTVDFDCAEISISNVFADTNLKVGYEHENNVATPQYHLMDWECDKTITLRGKDGAVIEKGTYLITMIPQDLISGFTMSFNDGSGKIYTKTTIKPVTLTRGHILNIGTFSRSNTTEQGAFEGEGTEASPYLITSLQKLKLLDQMFSTRSMVDAVRGKYFKQTTDIDCGGQVVHIGHYIVDRSFTGSDLDAPFDGTYDGNGKKITNYRLGSVEMTDGVIGCGLFPYIKDATIKNLTVSPCAPDGHTLYRAQEEDYEYVIGCLVGMGTAGYYTSSGSSISNCHVLSGSYDIYGRESSDSFDAYQAITYGGIVGRSPQKIEIMDCSNAADVYICGGFTKGMSNDIEAIAGGIVGKIHNADGLNYISRAEIHNCRNTGNVHVETKADNAFSGGIVGYIYDQGMGNAYVHILNCVNSGYIYANSDIESSFAGGIIGFNNSDGYVEGLTSYDPWVYNCLNIGGIEALNGSDCSAAGIIGAGYDADTEVIYCVNAGNIYAQSISKSPTVVRAAISGLATSMSTSLSAYCVGCYWISDKDESGKPVLPIIGCSNPEPGDEYDDDDYFDCYCYTSAAESGSGPLTPYVVNNRIYQGWDAKDSANGCGEWTKAVWLAKAAKWVWRNGNLDLDFTQLVSL